MPGGRRRQDVCAKGHPLTPDNVIEKRDGSRRCRTCHNEYAKLRSRRLYDAFYRSPWTELGIQRPRVIAKRGPRRRVA